MRTFLLDTSVIRSASVDALDRLRRSGLLLAVSSYTIWELLAHLDEGYGTSTHRRSRTASDAFRMFRANILKTRQMRRLGDPYREFARIAGTNECTEIEDEQTIQRLFSALECADSIFAFDRIASDLGLPHFSLLAWSTREWFKSHEGAEHVGHIRRLTNYLQCNPPRSDVDFDLAVHQAIAVSAGEAIARGASPDAILARLVPAFYLRDAYFIERGLHYVRSGRTPDANDFVDGNILRHMHILGASTLVTLDSGTRNALQSIFARLQRLGLPTLARVTNWPIPDVEIREAQEESDELRSAVREHAYYLWQTDQAKPGRDQEHWLRARNTLAIPEELFL